MPVVDLGFPSADARIDRPYGFAVTPHNQTRGVQLDGFSLDYPLPPTDEDLVRPDGYTQADAAGYARQFPSHREDDSAFTPGKNDLDFGSEAPNEKPSVLGAAFRQGNSFVSLLTEYRPGPWDKVEEGYNPWDEIKGTKYEPYWSAFADIHNPTAAAKMKQQIEREVADRKALETATAWASIPAQITAAALDWPTFLPGGAIYATPGRAVRLAGSSAYSGARFGDRFFGASDAAIRSGASVSASAIGSTALQEAALHDTQVTRTWEESRNNLIGAGIIGGGLGAGIGGSFYLAGCLGSAGVKLP